MIASLIAVFTTLNAQDSVFSYHHEGNTLYYLIDSNGSASLVSPEYPNFNIDTENYLCLPWLGYTEPKDTVIVPDSVEYNGVYYPVTHVMERAFERCDSITYIVFPSTLRTIGLGAMAYCQGLQSVSLQEGLVSIDGDAFYSDSNLLSIVIPEGVTSIGAYTFTDCILLTSVTLPNSLTLIDSLLFYNCPKLQHINMPANLVEIGPWAFDSDSSLTEIILPEGFRTINGIAFQNCSGLRHVSLPSTLDSVGPWAFYSCSSLDTMIFPDALQHIGKICMEMCSSLSYCHLPEQLKFIDEWLLYGTNLTTLEVPSHVTHIDMGALAGCLSLHKVILPASLTALGDSVFIDGTPLDTLVLRCTTPPTVNESAFTEYTATLIVPCGSAQSYRQHSLWSRFSNITEDCSTGIEGAENEEWDMEISVVDRHIVVAGAKEETVQVFDITGRHIINSQLPMGVFLVKVENHPAHKVIVMQ